MDQIVSNGKDHIDAILLDFNKAFDVVPLCHLPKKLTMYGITGKTHRWIGDFLGNRSQKNVVNKSKFERRMAKSGVSGHSITSTPLSHLC